MLIYTQPLLSYVIIRLNMSLFNNINIRCQALICMYVGLNLYSYNNIIRGLNNVYLSIKVAVKKCMVPPGWELRSSLWFVKVSLLLQVLEYLLAVLCPFMWLDTCNIHPLIALAHKPIVYQCNLGNVQVECALNAVWWYYYINRRSLADSPLTKIAMKIR